MKNLFDFKKLKKKLRIIKAAYLDTIFISLILGLFMSTLWTGIVIDSGESTLSIFIQSMAVIFAPVIGAVLALLHKIRVD